MLSLISRLEKEEIFLNFIDPIECCHGRIVTRGRMSEMDQCLKTEEAKSVEGREGGIPIADIRPSQARYGTRTRKVLIDARQSDHQRSSEHILSVGGLMLKLCQFERGAFLSSTASEKMG